jgi:hypothetical protein
LAELRHDGSDESDNLNISKAPPVGAFVLRRYDRGIREGALHQYPCHIAVLHLTFSISKSLVTSIVILDSQRLQTIDVMRTFMLA